MRLLVFTLYLFCQLLICSVTGQDFKVIKSKGCYVDGIKLKKGRKLNPTTVKIVENGHLEVLHHLNYYYQFKGAAIINLDSLNSVLINRGKMLTRFFGMSKVDISKCKNEPTIGLNIPTIMEVNKDSKLMLKWTDLKRNTYIHLKNIYDEYLTIIESSKPNYLLDLSQLNLLPADTLIIFISLSDICERSVIKGIQFKKTSKSIH